MIISEDKKTKDGVADLRTVGDRISCCYSGFTYEGDKPRHDNGDWIFTAGMVGAFVANVGQFPRWGQLSFAEWQVFTKILTPDDALKALLALAGLQHRRGVEILTGALEDEVGEWLDQCLKEAGAEEPVGRDFTERLRTWAVACDYTHLVNLLLF